MDSRLEAELRRQLDSDKARLESEIPELRDVAVKATTYLEDETDAYDNHMADDASSLTERQTDMTLLQNLERELEDVKAALQRLEEGSYGRCENCGEPIGDKRLQARPAAALCINCQSALERRQRRESASATYAD